MLSGEVHPLIKPMVVSNNEGSFNAFRLSIIRKRLSVFADAFI
jgi:hypothetical protein